MELRNYRKGKFDGKKLKKTSSVKDKNRGGRTGITSIIYRALEKLRATTVSELATYIWESDEQEIATGRFKSYHVFNRFVAKTLKKFYAKGKITCLRFRTSKGIVYGISSEDCWKYVFEKELVPTKLIKTFMQLIGQQGFVTNIELKEMGFTSGQIKYWIEKKLWKEGNYIICYRVNDHIKVYFPPKLYGQLQNFLNSDYFREIYEKYTFEKSLSHELGKVLEKIVEELYKKMGYEYRSQFPIFDYGINEEDPKNNDKKLIAVLDGLAFKRIEDGNSPNDLIIVECKNCTEPITFSKIAHLIFIRNNKFKGRGEIHVIALNGVTKTVWKMLRFYPFIRIINWKKFKELCEKYKPETYLKIKEQFGEFKIAIAYLSKEIKVGSYHKVTDEIKQLWKTGDQYG